MISSRTRWVLGVTYFFAPTLLMGVDWLYRLASPEAHLPGGLLYVSLAFAAIGTAALILTAPLAWRQRLLFMGCVWCLVFVQLLLLAVWALMIGGMEGIQ